METNRQETWRLSRVGALIALAILLSLFVFRVLAQMAQYFGNVPFLPRFEMWHSGTLPYGWLVFSQLIIIGVVLTVMHRIRKYLYRCTRQRALALLWIGGLYFLSMLLRFIVGITGLAAGAFLGAWLPAMFHMVLAGMILTIGLYELHHSQA